MALDRHADAGHARQNRRMAGGHAADALGADIAPARLQPLDAAVADIEAGHLAVLDDVDAELARRAGKSPGHGVVARDAGARLKARAEDRIAPVGRDIDQGNAPFHLLSVEHERIDAVEVVGVDPALDVAHVLQRVAQIEDAALAEHDVEVQVMGQPLPELERVLVEKGGLVPEIVRADDGGVARRVAAAEVALLDDGDVACAVVLGEIVGRRKAVPARADDDEVIGRLRLRTAPRRLPPFVVLKALVEKRPE